MEAIQEKTRSPGSAPGNRWKYLILWLAAAAVLAGAAIGLERLAVSPDQIFPVYITEVVASNTSYPNSDGRCCDYLEIYNGADYPVDLSGFQIGDIAGKQRYAFPAGTVIQPGEYLVVYCDKSIAEGSYAPFEINRAGAESFYLIAKSNAIVDSVTTLPMDIDQSMVLMEDGTWHLSDIPTPGRANEPSPEYGNIHNTAVSPVRISEFSAGDTGYLPGYGIFCDWVELYNTASEPVDITGYILSDNVGNDKYIFPQGSVLEANSYLVVCCTDRVTDETVAPFGLSQQAEESVILKDPTGKIADIVRSLPQTSGSMQLNDRDEWIQTEAVSPGYENTDPGRSAFLRAIGAEAGSIRITEVMAGEQLVIPDRSGGFPDWVELCNTTDTRIDLSGWCLSDDPSEPRKWIIPELILEPGQRQIIFCSGEGAAAEGELHCSFSLSAGGESLTLTAYPGNVVDSVSFPASEKHCSFTFDADGQAVMTGQPTPGWPNDEAGQDAFWSAAVPAGPLAIWEVMTSNDKYLPQKLGQCYDWVELRNVSNDALDLSGYSISDDPDIPRMHQLAGITLQPGETLVVILSDEENVAKAGFDQALFVLNVREDQLFLFGPEGNLLDYVHLKDIPLGCSYGRSEDKGGFYYMEPSPQNPNTAGYRLISSIPVSSYVPGVYTDEEGFSVTLEARGNIYYTTDGSVPGPDDSLYTGPIHIDETIALRAVAIEEGKMVSDIYTATFVVGDIHELPVVSLVTDPKGLWGRNGIYRSGDISVKETQLPAHVSYSGPDGSFAINCAMNLHGATTVTAFSKKTFAVRFQDRFDGPLHYDVFGDGEVTAFSSLLIRTAHESTFSSQMHDAFICHIASQASDKMVSQKYKYVALYLNGEYWGLYALRERHSEEHFASYMDVPAEDVQIVRWLIDDKELEQLFHLCERRSLQKDEDYAYAKSIINMESYVDWLICEAYMANIDINANLRFYRNPVDGLWYMGLSDLDLGMMGSRGAFGQMKASFHHGTLINALMANEEFQDLLATRLAELLEGPLSDENAIALINHMADTIRPEAAWEAQRWGTPVYNWEATVREMIDFCDGRAQQMIDSICLELRFTPEEREAYFGHLE